MTSDNENRTPPIVETEFTFGPTVVTIEDLRVSRGRTRRPASSCGHGNISYDKAERRVWCRDCEQDVEAFDAFMMIVERYDRALKRLAKREEKVAEAEGFALRSLAAKKMDEAWRKRDTVPACPHCRNGLFPEDFKSGATMLGREFALARRGDGRK